METLELELDLLAPVPVLMDIVVLLLLPPVDMCIAELVTLLPPVDKGMVVAVWVAMLRKAGNLPWGFTPSTIPLWQ